MIRVIRISLWFIFLLAFVLSLCMYLVLSCCLCFISSFFFFVSSSSFPCKCFIVNNRFFFLKKSLLSTGIEVFEVLYTTLTSYLIGWKHKPLCSFTGTSCSWMLSTTYPVILTKYTSSLQRATPIHLAELLIWTWKMKMIHFYMASSTLLCRQQSASEIWSNYPAGRKQLQHLHYSFPSIGLSYTKRWLQIVLMYTLESSPACLTFNQNIVLLNVCTN